MTVVRDAIEKRGRHIGVAENAGPFTAVQIGRDHHAGVLVELAEQVKQQRDSCLAERQVAPLVQNHQNAANERVCASNNISWL